MTPGSPPELLTGTSLIDKVRPGMKSESGVERILRLGEIVQGLKPGLRFALLAARMKSCSVARPCTRRAFPQPASPALDSFAHGRWLDQ